MSGGRKPPDLLVATSGGLRRSPRWRPHGSLPDFLGLEQPAGGAASWASPSVVGGAYAFSTAVNVEAYPDPAPAIVEVIAQYQGRSAEEMERLVTIPLEAALFRACRG